MRTARDTAAVRDALGDTVKATQMRAVAATIERDGHRYFGQHRGAWLTALDGP